MPLDTGAVTHELLMSAGVDATGDESRAHTHTPGLEAAVSIGAALRAAREHRGLSLADVADATKVRRAYLEAIEEMRFEDLPARPFTIGYIRSFAGYVGINPGAAVERYREDFPERAEPLRAPVGVRKKKDGRLSLMFGIGVIVLASIIVWNIAQRAMSESAPPAAAVADADTAPTSGAAALSDATPLALGAAKPAPPESTTPQAYVTPGLATEAETPSAAAQAPVIPADASPVFVARGKVYGASAPAGVVTLQARRSASIVVSGPDGRVIFAQQLQAGEAYRAPEIKGASLDVFDPSAWDVYVGGQIRAPLTEAKTPVSRFATELAQARAAAAKAQAARLEAVQKQAAQAPAPASRAVQPAATSRPPMSAEVGLSKKPAPAGRSPSGGSSGGGATAIAADPTPSRAPTGR